MPKEYDYEDCGHVLLGVMEDTSSFIGYPARAFLLWWCVRSLCDCVHLESGWRCRTWRTKACSFEEAHKGEGEDKPGR